MGQLHKLCASKKSIVVVKIGTKLQFTRYYILNLTEI